MTQIVKVGNETHEFPDEATPEMISGALGLNKNNNDSIQQGRNALKNASDMFDPLEVIKSGLLGMSKGGENIASTLTGGYAPKVTDDVTKMVGGSKNPIAEMAGQYAPALVGGIPAGIIPQMAVGGAYQALQSPEDPITGGVEGAIGAPAGIVGGKLAMKVPGLAQGIKAVMTKIDPKGLAYGVQASHDKLMNQASDIYNFIKSEVGPRGVSKIDLPEGLIDSASEHLPDTDASKDLINRAKSGDYDALHELQSDLGQRGAKLKGADLYADRNIGEKMLDTREKINDAIRDRFKEYGQDDLANLLDEAKDKYRYIKDTYYSHPTVAKLVGSETRKIPTDPIKTFSEESKPMGKLLAAHPEIQEAVNTSNTAKNFMKGLKKTAYVAGGTLAVPGLYESYDLLNLLKHKLID